MVSELNPMERFELEFENELDMLSRLIFSQPDGPTKEQKSKRRRLAIKVGQLVAYNTAIKNKSTLIKKVKAVGLLRNAIEHIDRWTFKRPTRLSDARLKIWVSKENRPLFTESIKIRLISALRSQYKEVVMPVFIVVGDGGLLVEESAVDEG
jgi:hypothetical protein